MTCPHCSSPETSRRRRRTALRCAIGHSRACACRRVFNERTGTLFNDLQHPTDIVLIAVLWRLRYKLSLRDVAELLLVRGFAVTHETVRTWELASRRCLPTVCVRSGAARRVSWYLDETYVKVAGRLALPLPGHRPRREPHRLDAQRAPRPRPLHADSCASWLSLTDTAPTRHDRPPLGLPEGDSLDHRQKGAAPADAVPEQPHGAGSSRDQAALLPDARLRELRLGLTLLLGLRRVATVPPCPEPATPPTSRWPSNEQSSSRVGIR